MHFFRGWAPRQDPGWLIPVRPMSPGTESNEKAAVAAKSPDSAAPPFLFGKSVHISVHMNVDRNMGRLFDVMWTTKSVHSFVPTGGPGGIAERHCGHS